MPTEATTDDAASVVAPDGDAVPQEDAPAIAPPPEPVSSPESDAPSPISPPNLEVTENPAAPVTVAQIPATPTSGMSAPVPQSADPAVAAAPAFDPYSADEISFLKNVLGPKAIERRRARVNERLDRIMEFAREKGTIDRTGVRLLLRVSSSSATRYLTALVASGRLARHHTQDDNLYKVVG